MQIHTRILRAFVFFCLFGTAAASLAQQVPETMYQEMRWRMIGPYRGGRTRALAGVPGHPNLFYMGAVNGGVWKTDDFGRTWTPIFDKEPTQSIGAIAVAPSDPNVIYVASGEGLLRPDVSFGDGVYKSTDAGKTWTHLGLRNSHGIPAIVVDPRDPNRVFAAVLGHIFESNEERGIYRSTDGGQSWEKILYKDENTGGSDVVIDPVDSQIMYASLWIAREGPWEYNNKYEKPGGGLFKSTDGGNTWKPLTNGFPKDLTQVYVAIAPSQHTRLYATIATTKPGSYKSGDGLGVYRSDDAGASWYEVTKDPRPAMRIGGGDLPVPKVDPKNPDVVYSTSIVTMRSADGGKTWAGLRGAPGGDDYQNIWINPDNPKIILLVSDQGALVTVNGGKTWSTWYNQPTAQIYHAVTTNTFPYKVCGGQQDSGSVCISSRGNDGEIGDREWHPVGAYEYAAIAPDPLNPDIVYAADRNEVTKFHWSTGQTEQVSPIPLKDSYRVNRTQPILFSPVDPHILYYAANELFKTSDGGASWQKISPDLTRPHPGIPANLGDFAANDPKAQKQGGVIYALAESFKTVNTLWAGTDDGFIWLTRDAGKNWKNITPPEMTAWSKVTQLAASHFDENTVYASVSRFRVDDFHPFIYRTHDAGKTWQPITGGLPDNASVDTVREDSARKGLLFAGTENTVWVSFDDGDHWQSLQLNLPHTSMRDLWIHENDLIVATHGRGFWILDDIAPLREVSKSLANGNAHLFHPALTYRIRRDTNADTPIPPDEPTAKNPPDGAILDYFLPKAASGPVTLEILDKQGTVVRRYSSTDKPGMSDEELKTNIFPPRWARSNKSLSTEAGMHRWVWDLHYPPPVAVDYAFPISAVEHATPLVPLGPRALPGEYTVRLTVDGQTSSAPLIIKMDPRVKASGDDLRAQFDLETKLNSTITQTSQAVLEAKSFLDQLGKLSATNGSLHDSAAALQKRISDLLNGPENQSSANPAPPTLSSVQADAMTLYGEDERADARPTRAVLEAAKKTADNFASLAKQWSALQQSDGSALNRQLRDANLPELHAAARPVKQD